MKKLFLIMLLMLLVASTGSAQNFDDHDVTVVVPSILTLSIINVSGLPADKDITINLAGVGTGYAAGNGGVSNNTTRLSVEHNLTARTITGQVTAVAPVGDVAGMFLRVNLGQFNGQGTPVADVELLNNGVPGAAQNVMTALAKGDYTLAANRSTVTYDAYADATSTGGNKVFTVTYTLVP